MNGINKNPTDASVAQYYRPSLLNAKIEHDLTLLISYQDVYLPR